jgi:CheY-like chemotaxis protein
MRLGVAFGMLIANAVESLPKSKDVLRRITLKTRTSERGEAVIEIRDSGVGMDATVLKRALEPFFSRRQAGQGRGLGLSICHSIVRSMGGSIELESEVGCGTVVRVVLPASVATAPPAAQASVQAAARGHVLIVDDEPMIRSVLQRILEKQHVVTCPKTSPEALALIDAGMRFDLILCDLTMPLLSGPAFFGELLTRHPDQARRTAFITGGAVDPEAVAFLHSNSRPCIDKPFDPRRLREVISALVDSLGLIERSRA